MICGGLGSPNFGKLRAILSSAGYKPSNSTVISLFPTQSSPSIASSDKERIEFPVYAFLFLSIFGAIHIASKQ